MYERLANFEYSNEPRDLEKLKHKKMMASWACVFGVGDCRAKAIALYNQWMKESDPDSNNP